ncbi:MAG: VTT domain-containing protein [Candidatus Woesebacteria bacterium]|jgi:membrane-associated protein
MFGIEITDLIKAVGVIGVMAIIFAESGILAGFFLPGDTLLFAAGFLTSQNALGIDVAPLILLLFVSAVAGDSVGYMFGKKVGPKIFKKKDSIFFKQDYLNKAEDFYKQYGPITIVLARFVPIVRTFAPVLGGVGKMKYRSFLVFNVIGGFLWTAGVVLLGYYAGAFFESQGINVDSLILPVVGLAMLLTLASPIVHMIKDKQSRELTLSKIKKLFKKS